jgi:phage terminase small subunit
VKESITAYVQPKVAKFIRQRAEEMEVSASNYMERLVEKEMAADEDAPTLTRKELLSRLESVDDPGSCIVHDSLEALMESLHGRAAQDS